MIKINNFYSKYYTSGSLQATLRTVVTRRRDTEHREVTEQELGFQNIIIIIRRLGRILG